MITRHELRPGLVLLLDPARLVEAGVTPTGPDRFRARGPHYFICVGVNAGDSDWIATSSQEECDRLEVHRKWGLSGWVLPATYADPYQVWTVPFGVLLRATLGFDHTQRGCRNFASLDFLEALAVAA
jgi:hypothetical protein